MIYHLTGGAWGVIIRRVLEAATRTLPLHGGAVRAAASSVSTTSTSGPTPTR